MEIFQPKTLDEAVDLLARGVPLAGGTQLTPKRNEIDAIVDLQGLGLDELNQENGSLKIGAMTRLQSLLSSSLPFPDEFREACRYEAAWNLRNQATLGGLLASADARSPLLTVLAALDPLIHLAPGDKELTFREFMNQRKENTFIILRCMVELPQAMAFEAVARTPMDLPVISASAACYERENGRHLNLALGGFGETPSAWSHALTEDGHDVLNAVADQAGELYQQAGDDFASQEYRAEVARILSRRVAEEVLQAC
jgi:putative selenate reductase FAD-binding subunit